jgi:hypothetical protein
MPYPGVGVGLRVVAVNDVVDFDGVVVVVVVVVVDIVVVVFVVIVGIVIVAVAGDEKIRIEVELLEVDGLVGAALLGGALTRVARQLLTHHVQEISENALIKTVF